MGYVYPKEVWTNVGHLSASLGSMRMRNSGVRNGERRGGDGLQVKILASKPPKCSQRTSKARRICESFERSEKWSQKARGEFFMASKNRKSSGKSERSGICDDVKVKFPLYVFPETMQKIDMLYEADNCKSKTEFIEKAIRFYCGYLLNKDSVAAEYAATQITAITEGIVKGTEQRLSRALFKVAVELGAVSHMLAAVHEIDDDTMIKLRTMCTDEVKRINGIINFEKAVRYQRN